MTTKPQRAHLAGLMDVLVQHEPQIHYAETRPMQTRNIKDAAALRAMLKAGEQITMDCSESVTLLCRLAGLGDPNGLNYDGFGFTGTLLAHLPHYRKPENAQTGALVVFGPDPGDHVAMVRRPGHDPELFNMGSERDPRFVSFSSERDAHRAPATFLSIAHLG